MFASAAKVIVWLAFAIANVRLTLGAGVKSAFPGWEAVIVQLTERPEVAVAPTVKSGSP